MRPVHFLATGIATAVLAVAADGAVLPRQNLTGHVPAAVGRLVALDQLPATTNLQLALALPLRNSAGLSNLLRQIADPSSTNFHHYLTPEQFTARFGPTAEDYAAVTAFAQANGLTVTATHPNRMILDVAGAVPDIERAFHVRLQNYPHPKEARTFYAPDVEPSVNLAVPLLHIGGLDNYALPKPRYQKKPQELFKNAKPRFGTGPGGAYMGNDFRAAYLPDVTLTGSGQSVGLLQFDGYTASDITYYETQAGLPNVTLTNVLLNGFNGAPSGSGGEIEVSLDIEMVISMAPGLDRVIVYEAGYSGNWHDLLNRMATDNLAKSLSCSWYIPGGTADATADQIFQQMAAQGQSFYSASGDSDAFVGEPDFPSESPYITQVGGTTLTTTGPGGSYVSETVWNYGDGTGSGGGICPAYAIPVWQQGISMANNQGSTSLRNIPDVALTADNIHVRANGANYNVGGTSAAAPLWAGLTALMNQLAATNGQPTVGFINPAIYALGKSSNAATALHDITTGNNQSFASPTLFQAVPGYDLCTGFGTPVGSGLLYALALPEPLRVTPVGNFIFSGPVGGPFLPVTQSYSLTNGGTTNLSWSLLSTSLWLNVSPTGGTLTPGGPATPVNLSISAAANALPPGSYTDNVWFTNLTDAFGLRRQFTLAIVTPPGITAQPTNQNLLQGMTANFAVATATNALMFYQWRKNGTNLTDGGNLTGIATSLLTISNVSPADVGTYSVIVTNAAGSLTSSNAQLTIVSSAPVITSPPASQSILPGAPVTFTVMAVGDQPFFYKWRVNGTNLTDGGNFSGTATSALTVSNVSIANAGTYSVIVSNALGATPSAGAVLTVISVTAPGVTLTSLASFTGGNSGAFPFGPLALGNDGNLYGTTYQGGALDYGTVFSLTTNGPLNTLVTFNVANGAYPYAGLALDPNGTFYGVAANSANGYGTVFNMTTNGTLNTLVAFNSSNGDFPVAGLVRGSDGNYYGTTYYGGALGYGLVFKTTTNGTLTVLHEFTNTDGAYPSGVLVADANGDFYGTTENGGNLGGWGTVFKITPTGTFTLVHTFNHADGGVPVPGLVRDADGNFYGTTFFGGTSDFGTVFKLSPAGALTTLWSFSGSADGANPWGGLLLASDGNLYGTAQTGGTYGDGTVFRIAPNSTALTTIVEFDGYNGAAPSATLTQIANGDLYGTTQNGGLNNNGTVFRISVNAPLQITGQPTTQSAYVGDTASFNVATFGSQPVTYQWRKGGINLTNSARISGVNTRRLTFTNIALANAGTYSVVVSNAYGPVTSGNAALQVIVSPPFFVSEPEDRTLLVGATTTFAVEAYGDLPLAYQWQKNGTNLTDGGNLSGTTTSTLTISNVVFANTGYYSVIVSNDLDVTASVPALLNVVTPQLSAVVETNGTLTLTWDAVPQQTYQLQFNSNLATTNWVNVGGPITATDATISLSVVLSPAPQRFYRVKQLP